MPVRTLSLKIQNLIVITHRKSFVETQSSRTIKLRKIKLLTERIKSSVYIVFRGQKSRLY